MKKPYFVLFVREDIGGAMPWVSEFGDYDREAVEFESKEGCAHIKGKDKKIVRVKSAKQSEIDAIKNKLNAEAKI